MSPFTTLRKNFSIGQKGVNQEMEFIIIAILGILGAGMIAGGFFLYRNSSNTNPKAIGVASVAAGVVMWGLILLVSPLQQVAG